jgi:transposase-like protein
MGQSFLLEHGSGIRRQYQTYVKVAGAWCSLYRAIDRDGTLVDVYLRVCSQTGRASRC